MNKPDFYDMVEWHEAGMPLDKTFVLKRAYSGDQIQRDENVSDWSKTALDSTCERVLYFANHLKDEIGAKALTLAPNTIYTQGGDLCFTHSYQGYDFTILVERVPYHLFLEAGAIVTLHSEDQ